MCYIYWHTSCFEAGSAETSCLSCSWPRRWNHLGKVITKATFLWPSILGSACPKPAAQIWPYLHFCPVRAHNSKCCFCTCIKMTGKALRKPGNTEAAHQSLLREQFAAADAYIRLAVTCGYCGHFSAAQSPKAIGWGHRAIAGFSHYHICSPYFLKCLHTYVHAS